MAAAPYKKLIHVSTLENLDTWARFRQAMCVDCQSACCTMPVEVKLPDLVRMGVVDAFEAEHEAPKSIAKRLEKARIVAHFNFKHEVFTLAQRASGDCIYLDAESRLCTIYDKRPNTCRNHPKIGPRPGFCAYKNR
ncbi:MULTISPECIES: YkgJ family cysteine cluster protein [Silvimonas]|uniref:YkgJ family cysteine cluster protein n=1 Tax=Silvimonas TaxID=300264 RepID=UPI0024B32775|nr:MULTISPECIES: YkgJ family cysteine cluster protein [Silvimonas]MDR3428140.1 YkgJ family cysteine cluster protein [Silvimonas sp.]